jgi:hypothetical protein
LDCFQPRVEELVTWVLEAAPAGSKYFDEAQPFSLIFEASARREFSFAVPAGPPPPGVIVQLIPTGWTPCRTGATVGFDMRFTNPGPAVGIELKAGGRLPDGAPVGLLDTRPVIGPGVTVLPLIPLQTVPGGLPAVTVTLEAAILEPALGVTRSRDAALVQFLP